MKKLIQTTVEKRLHDKIEGAAKKRAINKTGTFSRIILTELDSKGYFDSPLNEIKIIKRTC